LKVTYIRLDTPGELIRWFRGAVVGWLSDEVGLSNYVIYKIRKDAGISRPARPHKKFREVRVVPEMPRESTAAVTIDVSIKITREKGGLKITGRHSEVAALLKGML